MNTKTAQRERRILTSTESAALTKVVSDQKSDGKETDQFYRPDIAQADGTDAQARRAQQTLRRGEPEPLSKHEKQGLEDEYNKLKEWLLSKMVPRTAVGQRQVVNGVQNHDFLKAVKLTIQNELSADFIRAAKRLKNIARMLGREEDGNLESFRPS